MQKFSLFPIERLSRSWENGGVFDEDFDRSLLPFEIVSGVNIEDVSALIPDDEFKIHESGLGTYALKHLKRIKYAIVHRYQSNVYDAESGKLLNDVDQRSHSERLVQEIVACLRLIRPTPQHAQLCGGSIRDDGTLYDFHFTMPFSFLAIPLNQRHFAVRTKDAEALRFYSPLFRKAMAGEYWKFRMAVDMHQSGFFQNSHWKARYILWTSALESLFTSQGSGGQHSGSLVAKERIKFLLGSAAPIYPPGELTALDPDPRLTVSDVTDEMYCLRNNIAHGDKVPDYYYQATGRQSFEQTREKKLDTLIEATSSVVRRSLLKILKDGLIEHFRNQSTAEAYFSNHGLTKDALKKSLSQTGFNCPK